MQEVYNQLFCLLIFAITGILIGILFDIFRILRISFKTADWVTSLQDIIFWILTGGLVLFSIFVFNNGEIRSYIIVGIVLGIVIYMLAISNFFVKLCVSIIKFLKKIIAYPIKLIKNILNKIIITPILFLMKKLHNFTKFNCKQDKNCKKSKEKEGIF